MTTTVPDDEDHDYVHALITKHAGRAHAAEALASAVSWYDHWNAVTGAAHHVESSATRRVLEVQGGGILDRFMLREAA
jgi:hypothetical protein